MAKRNMKKGDFYAAKYKGSNGDLILGEVTSVRRDGDVILINLLTGNRATKRWDILQSRNHQVSKKDSMRIKAAFKRGGKKEARVAATYYGGLKNKPTIGSVAKKVENKAAKTKAAKRVKLIKHIRSLSKALEQAARDLAKLDE